MSDELTPLDSAAIEAAILVIHGERVMLDADLARFYGVPTKRLNEQVKRNRGRFPAGFVYQLSQEDAEGLRSQIATSKGRGGRRTRPYVFTEHGAVMLAAVLNSSRAVEVSVIVVRAFVRLRQILIANLEVAKKLVELEAKVGKHDRVIKQLTDAARDFIKDQVKIKAKLAVKSDPARPKIGFRGDSE